MVSCFSKVTTFIGILGSFLFFGGKMERRETIQVKEINGGLRIKPIKLFGHSEKQTEMAFGRDALISR